MEHSLKDSMRARGAPMPLWGGRSLRVLGGGAGPPEDTDSSDEAIDTVAPRSFSD